jgi:hypothetical protein
VKKWAISSRNVWAVFQDKEYRLKNEKLILDYDIFCDLKSIEKITNQGEKLYGEDKIYQFGKLILNWNIENFWRKCELLKKNK